MIYPFTTVIVFISVLIVFFLIIVATSNINCVDDNDDYVPTAEKKPSQLLLRAAHDLAKSENVYELASFRLNGVLEHLTINDRLLPIADRTWDFFHKAIEKMDNHTYKAHISTWTLAKREIMILKYAAQLAEDAGE